jgi:hypothetical protein
MIFRVVTGVAGLRHSTRRLTARSPGMMNCQDVAAPREAGPMSFAGLSDQGEPGHRLGGSSAAQA